MSSALATNSNSYWDGKILLPEQAKKDQLVWVKIHTAVQIIQAPGIIKSADSENFIVLLLDGTERSFRYETSLPEDETSNRRSVWVIEADAVTSYLKGKELFLEGVVAETAQTHARARSNLKKFRAWKKESRL